MVARELLVSSEGRTTKRERERERERVRVNGTERVRVSKKKMLRFQEKI